MVRREFIGFTNKSVAKEKERNKLTQTGHSQVDYKPCMYHTVHCSFLKPIRGIFLLQGALLGAQVIHDSSAWLKYD